MADQWTGEGEIVSVSSALMPALTIQQAVQRYEEFNQFVQSVLKDGVDYGMVPGTQKATLLKPGAEKLASLFGLSVSFELLDADEDWTGERHGGETFFAYRYCAMLSRNGVRVADAEGVCNSWEKKYRWRKAQRVCPNCGASTIIEGKPEYGGGFVCFAKIGGCKAKFASDDERITSQATGQVPNPDVADLQNTVLKISQKRALVAAVLIATNASEYFTQDMEDAAPIPVAVEMASADALGAILKLYRNFYPSERSDEQVLSMLFRRSAGEDVRSAANALKIMAALVDVITKLPEPETVVGPEA